jgi:hypothetical protein
MLIAEMPSESSVLAGQRLRKPGRTPKVERDKSDDIDAEYDFRGAPRGRLFDRYWESVGNSDDSPVAMRPVSDLESLQGVGGAYRVLLQRSGFQNIADLVGVPAGALTARMRTVNRRDCLVKRLPGVDDVADWIRQAAALSG